jgi:hypothetical protein
MTVSIKGTERDKSAIMLSVYAELSQFSCCYAECHYAECRCAECRCAKCRSTECLCVECLGAVSYRKIKKSFFNIVTRSRPDKSTTGLSSIGPERFPFWKKTHYSFVGAVTIYQMPIGQMTIDKVSLLLRWGFNGWHSICLLHPCVLVRVENGQWVF